MAYFPNGTAGMAYQERYCLGCRNYRDENDGRGPGCPIWDAHLVFPSHVTPEGGKPEKSKQAEVLDFLIPNEGIHAGKCTMLDEREDRRTLPLFPEGER